jgi:hypothetical protein
MENSTGTSLVMPSLYSITFEVSFDVKFNNLGRSLSSGQGRIRI